MIERVFRHDDLLVADRFDHASEPLFPEPVHMDAGSDHIPAFLVRRRNLHLGALRAWTMALEPLALRHNAKLIKQSHPEAYDIGLLRNGTMKRVWGTHEDTLGPSDLYICDPAQPFFLRVDNTRGPISCLGVEIPKRMLPLLADRANRLIGRPISGREGIGALLAQFLIRLVEDTGSYRPADGPHLGLVATDLVSALIARHLDEEGRDSSPESHRRILIHRIRAFIQQHLADSDLTPSAIAAAHHISLSYLHRLFRDEPFTVAASIRRQRMEHVRRDLADPLLRPTPIHVIAARWGFPRAADFTRAFRTTYGISPNDYRRLAQFEIEVCARSTCP